MLNTPSQWVKLPADAVEVARIDQPWGVKGWFKVHAYSAAPEALLQAPEWFALAPERPGLAAPAVPPRSADTQQPHLRWQADLALRLQVLASREHASTVVASVAGVQDRDQALALKGARLFVARAHFPATQQDEYYWVDLLGLSVFNREGQNLGVVTDIMPTGETSVFVIEREGRTGHHATLIPFVSAYVDRVDVAAKRIDVAWSWDG
jgi:16S rRNA processing protein RimM